MNSPVFLDVDPRTLRVPGSRRSGADPFTGPKRAATRLATDRCLQETSMPELSITSDPAVMLGKPVVAGTRITVELLLRKLGAGESVEELLSTHPRLTR